MLENNRVKILWDFQVQTDRIVMLNYADIVVVDKEKRKAIVVHIAKIQHKTLSSQGMERNHTQRDKKETALSG